MGVQADLTVGWASAAPVPQGCTVEDPMATADSPKPMMRVSKHHPFSLHRSPLNLKIRLNTTTSEEPAGETLATQPLEQRRATLAAGGAVTRNSGP